jgi:LytS/YehU family sensor histidine kinase
MNVPAIISTITIPRLLIHTFVENAIKHGIRPVMDEKMCTITITATHNFQKLFLTIQDDGIGREQASRSKKASTGKGIQIMKSHT